MTSQILSILIDFIQDRAFFVPFLGRFINLGGGQYLERVMFFLKLFDFYDFTLKLTKYLMFPNSHFSVKICNRASPESSKTPSCICSSSSLPCALHNMAVVNQIIDKNPLRTVPLLPYSNKINSLNSEQVFCSIQLKTCSELSE